MLVRSDDERTLQRAPPRLSWRKLAATACLLVLVLAGVALANLPADSEDIEKIGKEMVALPPLSFV